MIGFVSFLFPTRVASSKGTEVKAGGYWVLEWALCGLLLLRNLFYCLMRNGSWNGDSKWRQSLHLVFPSPFQMRRSLQCQKKQCSLHHQRRAGTLLWATPEIWEKNITKELNWYRANSIMLALVTRQLAYMITQNNNAFVWTTVDPVMPMKWYPATCQVKCVANHLFQLQNCSTARMIVLVCIWFAILTYSLICLQELYSLVIVS